MNIKVPENKLFAPPINIRVYDDRLVLGKPLIATRSLPLEAFVPWESVRPVVSEDAPRIVDEIPGAKHIATEVFLFFSFDQIFKLSIYLGTPKRKSRSFS